MGLNYFQWALSVLKEFVVLEAHFIHCIHPSQYIKVIKYHVDLHLLRRELQTWKFCNILELFHFTAFCSYLGT